MESKPDGQGFYEAEKFISFIFLLQLFLCAVDRQLVYYAELKEVHRKIVTSKWIVGGLYSKDEWYLFFRQRITSACQKPGVIRAAAIRESTSVVRRRRYIH